MPRFFKPFFFVSACWCVLLVIPVHGQGFVASEARLPDAIVRAEETRFTVENIGQGTLHVRRVVTILGPDGREEGVFGVGYDDRLRHLKTFSGRLLDANDKQIRRLKKEDTEDHSSISGYSLYEDSRVRIGALYHNVYPYTVEYEYEVAYDGLLNWPTWYPQETNVPVMLATFEVVVPRSMEARYDVRGMDQQPVITNVRNKQRLVWTLRDLPAYEAEPLGPSWQEQRIAVHTAPAAFEIEGARGNLSSWESFGRWYHQLAQGRGVEVLPVAARAEVQALTEGITDDREKARRLYTYMQEKTRYVSVQLGLGGWQPYDAAYVHERSYGDCKALTNYMRALLQAAGIPSFPALINNGMRAPEVLPHFPSSQFNHVILHVPLDGEPLWLECTSQTMPFGHIGASNEDRHALVVRPAGSELVRTPRSTSADNQRIRHATVKLTLGGSASAEVQTRYTGNQQDYVTRALAQATGREREAWLHDNLDLANFEIKSVDFTGVEARQAEAMLHLSLEVPRYASVTGSRLFLKPHLMNRWSYIPPAEEARTQPVVLFPYALVQADTIRYELPPGFVLEAVPDPVSLTESFATYHTNIEIGDDTLVYRRRLEVREPRVAATEYETLRTFLRNVMLADRAQVVLVRP